MAIFPGIRINDGGTVRDLRRLMTSELAHIERHAGVRGVKGLLEALGEFDTKAILGIVWVARKRQPGQVELAFEDVDVDLENFDISFFGDCGRHIAQHQMVDGKIAELPCQECAAEAATGQAAPPDPTAAVMETAPTTARSAKPGKRSTR